MEYEQMIAADLRAKPQGAARILHTADWHLGRLLEERSRAEEHALFLDWLLGIVSNHGIDAVIVAGDIFDSGTPPQSALAAYYDFVSRLHALGTCSLAVVAGNHDSPSQLEAPARVLAALNTTVVGFLPENPAQTLLTLPRGGPPKVVLALVPFLRDRDLRVGRAGESAEEIRAQLAEGIRACYARVASALPPGLPAMAVGHLTVAGSQTSQTEREIHIGGLGAVQASIFPKEFSYVALGHLHRPQAAGGDARVRYSGSPIPLGFGEADDRKEVRIVDFGPDGVSHFGIEVPVFRRLRRLSTSSHQLEAALGAVEATCALGDWLEVSIEDAIPGDDLAGRAQAACEGRTFEVVKVVRKGAQSVALPESTEEGVENLLDDPRRVFAELLDGAMGPEEASRLKTAFDLLLDRESDQSELTTPGS